MRFSILFLSLILCVHSFAQNNEETQLKLAQEFYSNKDYEKSIEIYEDVFKRNQSKDVYLALVNAYLAVNRLDDAEKIVKKQLRKAPTDPVYQVDHGFILISKGEVGKGESIYKDAIKDLPPSTNTILALSSSFQRRNETTFAIECLNRGKKLTGKYYGYEFELAELYYQIGDFESMINEYLDLIEANEGYLQNVQNALNTSIYHDPKKEQLDVLNQALLRRIQKNPDRQIFADLLIWHYLQQKDFKGAIVQTKALDKRNNENGYRFLALASSCRSNRQYDLAIECYQYIVDKGPSGHNYINARILMTQTIREKITSAPYTREDILMMEENYIKTMEDIGKNAATVSLQIGLSEVWAFYLNKPDQSVEMLNHALKFYSMPPKDAAKCKLLLADIYLATDVIWEASLLYSQVEKSFKYEALGDEAKFKNAMVYFYTGDFGWAKAQLDVLKGSTSKLIANDAMHLSLLISDNLAFDTSGEALKAYGKASLLVAQNQYAAALHVLDSMEGIFMIHNIIDEVYYLQYEIYFKQQAYAKGAESLEKIIKNHSGEILADEALFKVAELYEFYLDDTSKAQEKYKQLFTNYPGSIYVVESRNRYRKMRGDELN